MVPVMTRRSPAWGQRNQPGGKLPLFSQLDDGDRFLTVSLVHRIFERGARCSASARFRRTARRADAPARHSQTARRSRQGRSGSLVPTEVSEPEHCGSSGCSFFALEERLCRIKKPCANRTLRSLGSICSRFWSISFSKASLGGADGTVLQRKPHLLRNKVGQQEEVDRTKGILQGDLFHLHRKSAR